MLHRTLLLLTLAPALLHAADPLPGHSSHGEAFNEGPRQEAVLMGGTGDIDFPVTTAKPAAQAFFTQGMGQLHGFWFYEAERSFRQAAKIDPDCAMAYWGMAMANVNNDKRAKGFLTKAAEKKSGTSAREQRYIATLENSYREDKRDKKKRAEEFIRDLDGIVQDFPDDVEAKALLAWKLWHVKGDVPIHSPMSVNAVLDQVFAANPMHPAHHYRIHLWDGFKPARALASAARCGQAAPAIAHMWHMPGHIYSKVRRFDDAAWQQEASTRVDHAYMISHFILPDQIHNYAHNEEWLVRTFNELGRAGDAAALAKSLIALPQHPVLNTLDKGGKSAAYGRTRLIETLLKWELWQALIDHETSGWLASVPQTSHEVSRLKALGHAHFHLGDSPALERIILSLTTLDQKEAAKAKTTPPAKDDKAKEEVRKAEQTAAKTMAEKEASPPKEEIKTATAQPAAKGAAKGASRPKPRPSQTALTELRALQAVLNKADDAAAKLDAAKDMDKIVAARCRLQLGDKTKAAELANTFPQDLAALIAKASVLAACNKKEETKTALEAARKAAFHMDETLPAAAELRRLANKHGFKADDWRAPAPKRNDVGTRPPLARLGPIHWHPPAAPAWSALDMDGKSVVGGLTPGKPQLLLFYLGAECSHCVEQINAFGKVAADFTKAGITLQAISPQPPEKAIALETKIDPPGPLPFPILSDPSLAAFRSFRAHDDFENEPLHALVLLDGESRIRWIDVGYQPFMDHKFVLAEARRLLALPEVSTFSPVASTQSPRAETP